MESVFGKAADFKHESALTRGRISFFLLLLVILFCLWPELRLSPSGLQFSFKQSVGSMLGVEGYPRLTELAIIAFFCTTLWYTLGNLGKIGLYKYIIALSFLVIGIRLIHYSQFDVLRSGFISPMMLLCGCISLPMNKRRSDNIYFFMIVSVLASSLIPASAGSESIAFACYRTLRCDGYYHWLQVPGVRPRIPISVCLSANGAFSCMGVYSWKTPTMATVYHILCVGYVIYCFNSNWSADWLYCWGPITHICFVQTRCIERNTRYCNFCFINEWDSSCDWLR